MTDFSVLITDDFKQLHIDMITGLLADTALTVPCELTFAGAKWTDCPNCLRLPSGKSANKYDSINGVIFFQQGICPYCSGEGQIPADPATTTIYMIPIWNPRDFLGKWGGVQAANQVVQTLSVVASFDDIKKARSVIIDTSVLNNYTRNVFIRDSEPNPAGLGNTAFIFTNWKRSQ